MALVPKVKFFGSVPKASYSPGDCDDEFAVCSEAAKFAVADGATQASYSKEWARILVTSFLELNTSTLTRDHFESWLEGCRRKWTEWERPLASRTLPWFTKEKLLEGSASTFLGISFDFGTDACNQVLWKAVAFGDSCLFIVRGEWLIRHFPIEASDDFTATPSLLHTLAYPIGDDLHIFSGGVCAGDRIFMATDALAKWLLYVYETTETPWDQLYAISSHSELQSFVDENRANGSMRDDDVTLITIEIQAGHE